MSAHGDVLPLTLIVAIFFLGLAAFLWSITAQAERPAYRNGGDPNDVPPPPDYRDGADPDAQPPAPTYKNGSDAGAGSNCIPYRDGSDPDTQRHTPGC